MIAVCAEGDESPEKVPTPAGVRLASPVNALKGRGTRREVRGRILNHPPMTVGWEDQTAEPKGNGELGSRNL